MKCKTKLLAGLLSFVVLASYAQRHETKHDRDLFNKFKSKATVIAQSDKENLSLKRVCVTTSTASVIYTRSDDSVTVFAANRVSRREKWRQDTVVFAGDVARIVSGKNLAVYKLFMKGSRYQYLMFGGRDTIFCSILNDNGSVWSNQKLLSLYHIGKIGGVVLDNTLAISAFFVGCHASIQRQSCCQEDNVVMSLSTSDNAERWSNPEYEIKHNEISFDNISIAEFGHKSHKNKVLYMVLSKNENSNPYLSKSFDGGQTWSYPKKMSDELVGYGHEIVIEKDHTYITFKRSRQSDRPSNIYLWQGNTRDIEKEGKGKFVAKITDYDQFPAMSFEAKEAVNASTNMDIVGISKRRLYLIASAKWKYDKPTSILSILTDIKNIKGE